MFSIVGETRSRIYEKFEKVIIYSNYYPIKKSGIIYNIVHIFIPVNSLQ